MKPRRLDLVVKHRFFRHLIDGGDAEAEALYCWHIEGRTGGREPRSWKRSIDDYVCAATELLASMSANGFDPEHPVWTTADCDLLNGAHRTSCALALGIEVVVMMNRDRVLRPAPWDADWFARKGMPPAELRDLSARLDRLL